MLEKDKELIFNDLHPHMSRALQAAGLDPDSVLVELAHILFPNTEDKEGDDGAEPPKVKNSDKLRAMEIWSKMVGAYAPETKNVNVKGIAIGVTEPEDIDI